MDTLGKDVQEIVRKHMGTWFRMPHWGQSGAVRIYRGDGPNVERKQKCFSIACFLTPEMVKLVLDNVGQGCRSKRISKFIHTLDDETIRQLLAGIFLGDGHVKVGGQVRYTSVNHALIWSVSALLQRLRIRHVLINTAHGGEDSLAVDISHGEASNEVLRWMRPYVRDHVVKRIEDASKLVENRADYAREEGCLRVMDACERINYDGVVYDLCVEDDHSFIVHGVAVANCPDYRYRWAWAVKQRGSSRVGPQSLNQAWNRAPRITNPSAKPGLCKHILALRNYLYGKTVHFAGHAPDEEGFIEPSGEEQLQGLVTQLNQRAKWRLQKQQQRSAAQTAASSLVPGVGARATTQPHGKSVVTDPDSPVPTAAVPMMPKGDFIKAVRPALQKQVATRFIRPESMDPVVSNMKSLIEEQKVISGLLHEVGDADFDFPSEAPPTEAPTAEAPTAATTDDVPELPAPEEGEGSEVVELLRGILSAIQQLGGEEEVPEEGEDEEPVIPADAEEIDGEGEDVGGEDEGGEEDKEDEFDRADET